MNDKKTKIFWCVVIIFFMGSVVFSYWRFVIARDFVIVMHTECDPSEERCFVEHCDPDAEGEDEWVCVGDADEDVSYYKIQKRRAADVPLCDPNDAECDAFTCGNDEPECQTIYCGDPEAEEGGECIDPATYRADHVEQEDANEQFAEDDDGEDGDDEEIAGSEMDALETQGDMGNAIPVF